MMRLAAAATPLLVALWLMPPAGAAPGDVATCATSLPATSGGGRAAFRYMELMVGSPDGKDGKIAQNRSEFDASGKHGRDIFPLADEANVFLRCHYDGDRVTVAPLPRDTRQCEVLYTYIDDYDTRADRIFCR